MARLFGNNTHAIESATASVSAAPLTLAILTQKSGWTNWATGFGMFDPAIDTDYWILQSDNGGAARFNINGGVSSVATPATDWMWLVGVTVSTTSRFIWANGVAGSEDTVERTSSVPGSTSVGRFSGVTKDQNWGGPISHAVTWDVALSDVEIMEMAAGRDPRSMANFPVNYWPITGEQDPETDVIGANNLSVVGAPPQRDSAPRGHL